MARTLHWSQDAPKGQPRQLAQVIVVPPGGVQQREICYEVFDLEHRTAGVDQLPEVGEVLQQDHRVTGVLVQSGEVAPRHPQRAPGCQLSIGADLPCVEAHRVDHVAHLRAGARQLRHHGARGAGWSVVIPDPHPEDLPRHTDLTDRTDVDGDHCGGADRSLRTQRRRHPGRGEIAGADRYLHGAS